MSFVKEGELEDTFDGRRNTATSRFLQLFVIGSDAWRGPEASFQFSHLLQSILT